MEIEFYGANCLRFATNKKIRLVVDDMLEAHGKKSISTDQDITVFTSTKHADVSNRFMIDTPGEYEISEVSILGIPAAAFLDGEPKVSIYRIHIQDFTIGIIGNANPALTEEQLERLGVVDVLCIPVGGFGYTLDGPMAASLVKKIEPKIVIPTHYAESGLTYEVPQAGVDDFLKAMGVTDVQPVSSLKLKESDMTDKTQVVVLGVQ